MPISLDPQMMRAIIMDHYEQPRNKRTPFDALYKMMHIDSPNCIDDINVFLLEEKGVIADCAFDGVACTISTASTDIMTELVIGKKTEEALYIIDQYQKMIHEQPFDDSVLDEAIVFINTHRQAARIKCATIGWDALEKLLEHNHEEK
ncbi:MAG: SUF system NifU family Fe-S cluster assembly protein [Bacilli bacterium]